jgi:aminopeptidase 2
MPVACVQRIRVFPEWEVNSTFVAGHVHRAMVLDSKLSSHPIEVECPDANFINQVRILTHVIFRAAIQVRQIFDGLSYSKAASGK